jgi:hypothetical protein
MQPIPDLITWQVVASVLASISIVLIGVLYKIFTHRLSRMESLIKGIIRYLIAHSVDAEREALSKLIGD